jgi:hypothetical protein
MELVSDSADHDDGQRSSARGEAAWKADMERIAERNRAARKGGKERREAYERQREDSRRTAETRRQAGLIESRSRRRPSSP